LLWGVLMFQAWLDHSRETAAPEFCDRTTAHSLAAATG
jgi:hypothetical protein